ncbi:MAG: hypothetical protein JNK41_12770 [Saprospiraceae bacterium]|nr:hypothetical protein [Saprospiraceae bacterium]
MRNQIKFILTLFFPLALFFSCSSPEKEKAKHLEKFDDTIEIVEAVDTLGDPPPSVDTTAVKARKQYPELSIAKIISILHKRRVIGRRINVQEQPLELICYATPSSCLMNTDPCYVRKLEAIEAEDMLNQYENNNKDTFSWKGFKQIKTTNKEEYPYYKISQPLISKYNDLFVICIEFYPMKNCFHKGETYFFEYNEDWEEWRYEILSKAQCACD